MNINNGMTLLPLLLDLLTQNLCSRMSTQSSLLTQTNVMSTLLQDTYSAHNSLDDVKALQKLSTLVQNKLPKYTLGASEISNTANMALNKESLLPLQADKAITNSMATKIARSGLNYSHLKLAYERNGFDRLSSVLVEMVN